MNKHRVQAVDRGSIADELEIRPGEYLCAVNGEEVLDVIDYESLTTAERVVLSMEDAQGAPYEAEAEKDAYEPLGLNFESGLMSKIRSCRNRCMFCFIDQLPRGGRETLHVKDDDWRLSLIMGNYISLTNVDEAEFARILKRKVSPLYISVHATDGAVRKRMMNNPTADKLLERLRALKAAGLRFHAQVVLCPELNDKAVLEDTLTTLASLRPAAVSVAVVPVGLTRFREGLYPLRCLTQAEAAAAIEQVEAASKRAGGGFAYASDELYVMAGRELPPYEAYGDFPQIENGVGLLRLFGRGVEAGLEGRKPLSVPRVLDAACGSSAAAFLTDVFAGLRPYGMEIRVHAIENDYFGHSVTVSGLVTGGDLAHQLAGRLEGEALLLPQTMLRERDVTFLDGSTLQTVQERLGLPIKPMPAADGEAFIEELFKYCR